MKRFFTCVLVWMMVAGAASALTLDGVTFPDSFPVDGQPLVLNGVGLRTLTILNVRIYLGALYLPQHNADAQAILKSNGTKVILLHFLHSGSKAEVEQEYRKGEETNCGHGECAPSDQADFERLVQAAPAVQPGDTSTYIFTPRGVRVLANNRVIGEFNNPDLAYRLLIGFLGAHPPSESLKAHMLGAPN